MEETITVLAVVALIIFAPVYFQLRRCRNYNKTAGQGTRCYFFIEEDRFTGWITQRDGDVVTIHHMGKKYERNITQTYPA